MWPIDQLQQIVSFVRALYSPSYGSTGQVGDGREKALLEHVLRTSPKDDPASLLQAVDDFARRTWLMNVGSQKGTIVDAVVRNCNPRLALELGAYCGYSAVRISSQFQQPDSLLISIEKSSQNAEIAKQLIQHAGLSSKSKLLVGTLTERIPDVKELLAQMDQTLLDFVFIDHDKDFYLEDYLLLKKERLIGPETVIVADNMGFPGSPKFREYLKKAEELETVYHNCSVEYISWIKDTVTVSKYKEGY